MIELIVKAKKEILIASPWVRDVSDALKQLDNIAEKKRICVQILTRHPEKEEDKKLLSDLYKRKYIIEYERMLHAKLLLIDESELIIESANLIGTSLNRNLETALWTNRKKAVKDAKDYFRDLMADIHDTRAKRGTRIIPQCSQKDFCF